MAATVLPFPARSATGTAGPEDEAGAYLPLTQLKKQLTRYLDNKTDENAEAAEARRYYHGDQWTAAERQKLADRNQPEVTYNRVKKKIQLTVGVVEKLRGDPKAFPRRPAPPAEWGATLATEALRYALGWDWSDTATESGRQGAIGGISGVELVPERGDHGDAEVGLELVDQRDFFYDPNSGKADFGDASYMGKTRWVDLEVAQETWPEHADELETNLPNSAALPYAREDDRRLRWWDSGQKRVRIVDHWYLRGSTWYYCIYAGEIMLEQGLSPFVDEKGKSICKFLMWSADVDGDNDRYGLFRDLKSPQDEINHRRSKSLHLLNSRRVIAERGAVDDVEIARRELARPDGFIEKNKGYELDFDDITRTDAKGNLELLAEAKAEIDTYGPNPALASVQVDPASARAMELLYAAGIAEIGTFIANFRRWKLRVYRALWCAIQTFWTGERWIRVTDDQNVQQLVQVNGWQRDPQTGFPVAINNVAALDVDIQIAQAEQTINTMAAVFEDLIGMAKTGTNIPPELIIELSALPYDVKARAMQHLLQSKQDPKDQAAIQLKFQQEAAKTQEIAAHGEYWKAQALKAMAEAGAAGAPGTAPPQIDTPADLAKAELDRARAHQIYSELSDRTPLEPGAVERAHADTAKAARDLAQARRINVETGLLTGTGTTTPADLAISAMQAAARPSTPGGSDG